MKKHFETIVLGAGAAGMNCCLELQKENREYLLISPNIGGRIYNDEQRHMNYGAVFYFGTYKYMLRRGCCRAPSTCCRSFPWASATTTTARPSSPVSMTTVADAPSLFAHMKWMRDTFIPRYAAF